VHPQIRIGDRHRHLVVRAPRDEHRKGVHIGEKALPGETAGNAIMVPLSPQEMNRSGQTFLKSSISTEFVRSAKGREPLDGSGELDKLARTDG